MSESVKAPETKAPAKKTQAVTEAKTEAVLYVGPTISGIAITGTVYTTIPEAAKAAKADAPMILNLFIPIREYGEAERMIREKRGYVYSAYAEGSESKEGNQLHYDRERQSCAVLRRPADRHRNSTLESFSIMGKNDHSIQGVNRGGSSDRNLLRRRSGGYRSRKCNLVMRSEDRRDNRNEMPERMPGKSRRAYRSQTLRKTCGPFLMDRGLVR